MYKKVCNCCNQPSFSSCETGTWICPVCQKDITNIPAELPPSQEKIKKLYDELVKKLG
ncbi:hypothetical protein [Neobacillus sp. D3-1R]|uniref:hypothetical protein n=1 Tax=Neobacillus sp. D3-1R TaxID=3445778 RepID=UPI003F9ECE09